MISVATLGLPFAWIVLGFIATIIEPEGNRAYAETCRHAPVSELLKAQVEPLRVLPRADGAAGKVYRYTVGAWRGLKGRTYPGTVLGIFFGSRYMESGVHFYTAPSGAYCDVDFVTNTSGIIESIEYAGNDCG